MALLLVSLETNLRRLPLTTHANGAVLEKASKQHGDGQFNRQLAAFSFPAEGRLSLCLNWGVIYKMSRFP